MAISTSKSCPHCGDDHKKIPGYRGYCITNTGVIISHRRSSDVNLSQRLDKYGYYITNLRRDGRNKTVKVHRLLMMTFSSNWDQKLTVNHINGDKADNRLENLEMCSIQQNLKHSHNTRIYRLGEETANSKLTTKDVLRIRELYKSGTSVDNIAVAFNIHRQSVWRLARKTSWRWL